MEPKELTHYLAEVVVYPNGPIERAFVKTGRRFKSSRVGEDITVEIFNFSYPEVVFRSYKNVPYIRLLKEIAV